MPDDSTLNDQLDQIVAEFSDRVQAGGEPDMEAFLARVPEPHRPALARCLRMIRSGLTQAPSALRPLGPGVTLDGYRIERELGKGGMATVYLAEQLDLHRPVALKVLRPGLAVDARHVDRFRREALAVAKLTHQHIVQIHAVGEADGYHYLVMEYVEGKNLAEILSGLPKEQTWTAQDLGAAAGIRSLATDDRSFESAMAELLLPVARAIAVAHELGLVHRDIKPSNILVDRDGRAMVADFGLAKGDDDPALSMTGEPLGTPYYMSPEQAAAAGHRVDERSDIYSLGVTLFECLSGARPFDGKTAFEVMDAIREGVPKTLRNESPTSTRSAEAVVQRAMAYRKEDRYGTAIDFAADLAALAEGRITQALVERGGVARRSFAALARISQGRGFEYVSPNQFLGLPLVHINYRRRRPGQRRLRVAKGWFAMSDLAIGGVAVAPFSVGLFALGAISFGMLSLAGLAMGGFAMGGGAAGLLASGGCAAGVGAAGGLVAGYYAFGGLAGGVYVIDGQGRMDPEAIEFFDLFMPWMTALLPG